MKVIQVEFAYSRLHNVGDYSNVRADARASATIDEGDDPAMVLRDLTVLVREAVREAVLSVAKAKGQMVPVDLVYQMGGLPVTPAEPGAGSGE